MPDKSVDAIITDLPYGTTACSWDVIIPFAPMWEQVKRICKGVFVTTASQPFTSLLVYSNFHQFKYEWIWEKPKATGHLDSDSKPLKEHENIEVFGINGYTYNPQLIKGQKHKRGSLTTGPAKVYGDFSNRKIYESNEFYPRTILQCAIENKGFHPTQKPVALYEYLIRTYTNEGDTVFDFTCGSGTTGVACVNTNRNCILVDNNPEYIEIARKRIHDAQQQMRLGI
jgi:site-specific DNA-methyltransferase (adenine-specific)